MKKMVLVGILFSMNLYGVDNVKGLNTYPRIKKLDLSRQKLTKIPEAVLKMTSLQELNLSNNKDLIRLPEAFIQLKNLKELNIIQTNIQLPEGAQRGAGGHWKLNSEFAYPQFPDILLKLPKLEKVWILNFTRSISDEQLTNIIAKGLDVRNLDGDTLMMYAVQKGDLLHIGQINVKFPWMLNLKINNVTPLIVAIRKLNSVKEGLVSIKFLVSFLLELGAKVDLGAPLVEAATGKPSALRTEIFKLLLDKGAKIAQVDTFGNTVLMQAANWANHDLVKLVLKKDGDVDARNKFGQSALSKVLRSEHGHQDTRLAIIDLLLLNHAAVDEGDLKFVFDEYAKNVEPMSDWYKKHYAESAAFSQSRALYYRKVLKKLVPYHQEFTIRLIDEFVSSLQDQLPKLTRKFTELQQRLQWQWKYDLSGQVDDAKEAITLAQDFSSLLKTLKAEIQEHEPITSTSLSISSSSSN